MKLRKPVFLIIILILTVQLACNWPGRATPTPDAMDLINTAAAQTVVAQLTEIAPKSPTPGSPVPSLLPSPTLLPTITQPPGTPIPTAPPTSRPTSTPLPCNWAQFVKDVTVPDDTQMTAGTTFTKVWRLKNIGSCTWTPAYAVVFVSGDAMGGNTTPLPRNVPPGDSVDVGVNMTAPASAGTYKGNWMLRDQNTRFGIGANGSSPFWVQIKVISPPDHGVVYNFADSYCSASWSSGAGNLTCPGKPGDASGFVIRLTEPQLENRNENEPTIWTQPQNVDNGYIQGIYPAFPIKTGDRFIADIGCLKDNNDCNVFFELDYQVSGGDIVKLGEWNEVYDGNITRVDQDLSGLDGKSVVFILKVRANGSAKGDAAFWLVPQIKRP